MRKKLRSYMAALLIIILVLCGCQATSVSTSGESPDKDSDTSKFEAFTKQLFVDSVSSDALTLHYELIDPSAYEIDLDTVDLGRIDTDISAADNAELEDALRQLHRFHYENLTEEQQLTYDILDQYLQTELAYDSTELYYYPEVLSSTSGTHSILPILMAEYQFYNKEDIDTYLTLLGDFPAYFENILDFERAKSEAGLFMCDESVDEVVAACQEFIKDTETNTLLEIFPEKLAAVADLTDAEIADYTEQNERAVLESVIPAYESLISGLEALKGTGKNENGLYYYEHGLDYYDYLVKTQTATNKSPEELIELLDDTMEKDMTQLAFLIMANEDLYSQLESGADISMSDPNEILETLQEALKENFPEAVTDQYSLKYVPESLEESMNPAFYMIPPVDAPEINTIYLNNSQLPDNTTLFTTLAHEGYPGHLYQHSYFVSQNPDPIRQELSFLGYIEGWATYVENMSYAWTGLDDAMVRCLQINQEVTLCLYARIDLGVHYEGWTEADVQTFLTGYGIEDAEVVHEVFRAIVSDPAVYLPYCIGSLEFNALQDKASEAMGESFNLKDFHEFLLNLGPCQFEIIDKYMEKDLIIS